MIVEAFPIPETPMNIVLQPWHLMVMFLASWVNRQQQEVIEYPLKLISLRISQIRRRG